MNYTLRPLKDLVFINGGKRLPKGKELVLQDTGHPYIRAQDIRNGTIRIDEPLFVPEDVFPVISRYIANDEDVCIVIVGANVGDVGIVPSHLDGANLTENAVKLRDKGNQINQHYLKYCLLTDENQRLMKQIAGGSAQPKLGLYKIESILIPIPDMITQCKIASILSAYDDLIENSRRRIKILEEMAQSIYREWFVNFRFPGHEKVRMVDSKLGKIPEGWEIGGLTGSDKWDFISSNIRTYDENKEYFATADIEGIEIVNQGKLVSFNEKPSRAQKEPVIYSVWFARMRDTHKVLGFTTANEDMAKNSILSSGFAGFRSNREIFPFLYYTINSTGFHEMKNQFCTGATQMSLTNEGLSRIDVITPPLELINKYGAIVLPILDFIFILQKQKKILRQTHDLLLPRLISGDLDVAELDIPIDDVGGGSS